MGEYVGKHDNYPVRGHTLNQPQTIYKSRKIYIVRRRMYMTVCCSAVHFACHISHDFQIRFYIFAYPCPHDPKIEKAVLLICYVCICYSSLVRILYYKFKI
jgi:hypothetical protein